jgi:hypothetical protein
MTKEEKLEKIRNDFVLLSEEKQDYILGILQALAFAKDEMADTHLVEPDENKHKGVMV